MYKWIFVLLVINLFVSSCGEEPQNTKEEKEAYRPLIEREDGQYREWYPGHKQLKLTGREDSQGRRTGVWKMFTPEGYDIAITVYKAGKRHGHIIVYHPNGAIHYTGEYEEDERIGEWKFYDENGKYVKTENFSK